MNGYLPRIVAVALALGGGLVSGSAAAQVAYHPVYFSPNHGTGVTIAGDFGLGPNDDAKAIVGTTGTPLAYGGHITLGLPMVTITGIASAVDPKGLRDTEIGFGANLALTVFKAPLMPVVVSLQGGAGYVKFDRTVTDSDLKLVDVPVGLGVAIDVPNPVVAVEPWAAPRIHVRRSESTIPPPGGSPFSETKVGVGISGGLNLTLPIGVGLHVAADWMTIDDPVRGGSTKPVVLGIGLHMKLSVPSLGIPGGVL